MNLLRFEEFYVDRIWGGEKLRTLFEKKIPGKTIGEAWIVADHPVHESVVLAGPHAGMTLRNLLVRDAAAILGSRPRLTPGGRFPLLLKILDAADVLSVQVHPDDACAARLGEPDVGKTEMWHVLQAEPGSKLICGLKEGVERDTLCRAMEMGGVETLMAQFDVQAGDSVFVPAGTVHAIGAGLVLAEIQQNSDLTYRLYDWNRVDAQGKPRALHLEKSLEAILFDAPRMGLAPKVELMEGDVCRRILAVCPHFTGEEIRLDGIYRRLIHGETFHILLAKKGMINFNDGDTAVRLFPGQALLVPGSLPFYEASGNGSYLDYYVADVKRDIINPLVDHGFNVPELITKGLIAC